MDTRVVLAQGCGRVIDSHIKPSLVELRSYLPQHSTLSTWSWMDAWWYLGGIGCVCVCDGQDGDLARTEPQGPLAPHVLNEDSKKALEGA